MNNDLYKEIILEEYDNPQNRGQFADADVTLHERNSSCGDELTLYLKLDPTKTKIVELKWEGNGCAVSMASMSLLSQKLLSEKATLAETAHITREDMEQLLGIDQIAEGRVRCMMLGVTALHKHAEATTKTKK